MYPINTRTASDSKVCPDCASTSFEEDLYRGEVTCEDCGLVVEENLLDEGPPSFAESSSQATGPRTPQFDRFDGTGRELPQQQIRRMNRLLRTGERHRKRSLTERRTDAFRRDIGEHIQTIRPGHSMEEVERDFKGLYNAVKGQSVNPLIKHTNERRRSRHQAKNYQHPLKSSRLTSVRTNRNPEMTHMAMAVVLVHEHERDPRPIALKVRDAVPFKYSLGARNNPRLNQVEQRYCEHMLTNQHDSEPFRRYVLKLFKAINELYTPSNATHALQRKEEGSTRRATQLEALFSRVCASDSRIPVNALPQGVFKQVKEGLERLESIHTYPLASHAPNQMITCQVEIVVHVLRYLYEAAKVTRPQVRAATAQLSNRIGEPSRTGGKAYQALARDLVRCLEASS